MILYNFLNMYDNWNGHITINDDDLNPIIKGKVHEVAEKYTDAHGRYKTYSGVMAMKVVAFGFYDNELTVRVRETDNPVLFVVEVEEDENETDTEGT